MKVGTDGFELLFTAGNSAVEGVGISYIAGPPGVLQTGQLFAHSFDDKNHPFKGKKVFKIN